MGYGAPKAHYSFTASGISADVTIRDDLARPARALEPAALDLLGDLAGEVA